MHDCIQASSIPKLQMKDFVVIGNKLWARVYKVNNWNSNGHLTLHWNVKQWVEGCQGGCLDNFM